MSSSPTMENQQRTGRRLLKTGATSDRFYTSDLSGRMQRTIRSRSPSQYPPPEEQEPPKQTSWQYLVLLCTLSVVICYADRSNISTAIIPMAEHFGWDSAYRGFVLSAFFGGYAATQILGGSLADRLGGKLVLASGVALWSLFTVLTPSAAATGTTALIAARILLGVGEGVAFPSIHSIIARNVPVANQSTAVAIATAASYGGTALAFGISPLLVTRLGWPWVFYLFGASAVLWLPLWWTVKLKKERSEPGSTSISASIRDVESIPLMEQAGGVSPGVGSDREGEPTSTRSSTSGSLTPADSKSKDKGFWALMRRKEVWAICVCQYMQSWGMYGLLNWLPTFFNDYYHIQLEDLGSYTLLPYLVQGTVGAASGLLADQLLSRGWKVKQVRVMLQTAGMLGPAACLLLAVSPSVGASASVASSLITVGLGLSALTLGGVSASHLDIAPRHAGVIFGAGNTAATLAGLLSVPATGLLLQQTGSWALVFGITAVHYLVGTLVWWWWSGDRQLPEDNVGEEVAGLQRQMAE